MIKLINLLKEENLIFKKIKDPDSFLQKKGIEWTEKDESDRFETIYKDGKKKVAYYEPKSKNKTLKIVSFKSKDKARNITDLDKQIHEILSEWVISSLSHFNKRDKLAKQLLSLNIPKEYKKVPSSNIYRVINLEEKIEKNDLISLSKKGTARSWAYHPFGIDKMADWYDKIYKNKRYKVIIKKPVKNVIICIPTFYNLFPSLSTGKAFDSLWASEYEVICENKNPLLIAKPNEWEFKK